MKIVVTLRRDVGGSGERRKETPSLFRNPSLTLIPIFCFVSVS